MSRPRPRPGTPHPLGASLTEDGVNFSVYSRSAERVDLLLYDSVDDAHPRRVVPMEVPSHRTYHYWHAAVPRVPVGQIYAYRADGPFIPAAGLRFDASKVLLDPYGRAVATPTRYDRAAATLPGPNDAAAFKSVVVDVDAYDWEGDEPLHRPFSETVVYELHVRGFTRHRSSGVKKMRRGTYAGLVEKIPYLVDLGITAVELMPVFQFDAQDAPEGLTNYWGYSPVSFFAPHCGYSSKPEPLAVLDEFRDMVKALHRAGIEVILDVVYNHTSEAGEGGPTQCFRGLENPAYYLLENGGRDYANYAGTGNTLNANQSTVRRLILDSLRYWVQTMHIDGFRFDLASILSRDQDGRPLPNPPVLWDIESDPILAGTKLIAEAWDAAGLYQVGRFVGDSWKEWNGRFRDDVRAFVKGDPGMVPTMADRLRGSPDLYGSVPREPERSINFITSHDGFTLNDLVSYERKHNLANGEHNRDGDNHNLSWNHGIEGPTDDPDIDALRERQIKNFLAITLLSLGAPMLLMGDEMRRTQRGNNNAYVQDNDVSWLDWTLLDRHAELHRFVKGLIELRAIREDVAFGADLTLAELMRRANVGVHGVDGGPPDTDLQSRSLAISGTSLSGTLQMYLIVNAYWNDLAFTLPDLASGDAVGWRRVVDTSLPSPEDVTSPMAAPLVEGTTYPVAGRSVVVLYTTTRSA